MDLSFLPDIFTLGLLILAFRPLVRRAGVHVNVWFVGWAFLLLHAFAMLLARSAGPRHTAMQWLAVWSLDLGALAFLLVTANAPVKRIGHGLAVLLAVPVLFQSSVALLPAAGAQAGAATRTLACVLFLLPAMWISLSRALRTRPMFVLSGSFALFGVFLMLLGSRGAGMGMGTQGALSLLFLLAAYFSIVSVHGITRGLLAVVAGFVGCALSYPALALFVRIYPSAVPNHELIDMPQYLLAAGMILTLLEEHMTRTERLAMHDPLTDLPNRRLFDERLVTVMSDAHRDRTTVACLVIDIDNFKSINDTLGHSAGDKLLRALAVRLSWHMSPRDILARTGGDEFTALLAGVHDEHHLRFIASAMMSAASVPVLINNKPVDVRISIGIALSPDHADDVETLRHAADEAMYTAKRRGGSLLAFAGED